MNLEKTLLCYVFISVGIISCQSNIKSTNDGRQRAELLYWATKTGNIHIGQNHLSEVAACVLAKDEHMDILEFIDYHEFIGIGKFYIYDNNSNPPMLRMLEEYIKSGLVDYQYVANTFLADDYHFNSQAYVNDSFDMHQVNSIQTWCMTNCIRNYASRHEWIVIIDVDEFIIFEDSDPYQNPPNLPNLLEQYKEFGGLLLYRKFFGSSGLQQRPKNGVLASYTQCTSNVEALLQQLYPKVIANTLFLGDQYQCRVHWCKSSRDMVNTNNRTIPEYPQEPEYVSWNKVFIHHYAIKSLWDFKKKQERGMPHTSSVKNQTTSRDMGFFDIVNEVANDTCNQAVQFGQVCCEDAILKQNEIYSRMRMQNYGSDVRCRKGFRGRFRRPKIFN